MKKAPRNVLVDHLPAPLAQQAGVQDMMTKYEAEVRRLGCQVAADGTVLATASQGRVLNEWWTREHSK